MSTIVIPTGGGDSVTEDIAQATHGFVVGDVLDHNGTIFIKADADSLGDEDVLGLVSVVTDAGNFTITYSGKITTLSGLTGGKQYFLATTAGGYTDTQPAAGNVIKPIFYSISATEAVVHPQLGIKVDGPAGGGGGMETVRLGTDRATASTSFVDVTDLTFYAEANEEYLLEVSMPFTVTTPATYGMTFGLNGPATPTAVYGSVSSLNSASSANERSFNTYDDGTATTFVAAEKSPSFARLFAVVRNGSNAGYVTVRMAAETGSTLTVKEGAILKWQKTT